MIKSLHIKNYTLLKDVHIHFDDGFTVISGETGAGKSIMLDALSLLLGKRVERFSEGNNTSKSIIEGTFFIDKSKQNFFEEYNLDFDEETVIRREINLKGKSRAFINDTPVLLNVLNTFGKQVIEIHAQHQSILLKEESAQFKLIDQLAKSENELLKYQKELNKFNSLNKELSLIKKSGSLSASELDFFQFQLDELVEANLVKGEKEELEKEISVLENIDEISNIISESDFLLNNEQGVLSSLSSIKRKLIEFDSFNNLSDRVDSVLIELNDISSELQTTNNRLESDPENLLKLNNRLDLLNNLIQKHRVQFVEELINIRNELEQKITLSSSFEKEIQKKQEEIKVQLETLQLTAKRLNDKRNKVLPKVKKEIESHLKRLGMQFAQFEVSFNKYAGFHENGNTKINFMFSANKGSDMQILDKVASGGELSRLMLAIKYISAQSSNINTLVFDEIDTGISGEIASLMGDMMQKISNNNQLIAISHLPQIAAKAKQHLKVVKEVKGEATISNVIKLNSNQREQEIAKLLSGKEITNAAIENARELLNQ